MTFSELAVPVAGAYCDSLLKAGVNPVRATGLRDKMALTIASMLASDVQLAPTNAPLLETELIGS